MHIAPLRVLPTPDAIGEYVADRVLGLIAASRHAGRPFLLGCPTGRTPKPIFAEMGRLIAGSPRDLSHLVLVMMDEYLVERAGGLEWASADEPWSCHHFARVEIERQLNAGLPVERRLREDAIWFPDPRDPDAYDEKIDHAGGIDYFILASGASDGHVAFNPPGSPRKSRTRVIALSEETRRDNLKTFPAFGMLSAVPHHGVSVGIDTITRAKESAMVVWGESKRLTVSRIVHATRYDPDWPATLIHECRAAEIICDTSVAPRPSGI